MSRLLSAFFRELYFFEIQLYFLDRNQHTLRPAYFRRLIAAQILPTEASMRSRQLRQISACQFSSRSWSLEEDLLGYSNFGFESIGLWRQKLEDYGESEAVDLIHESNLSVSSLHFAGGYTGDDCRLKDSVADTLDAIDLAAQVNANCLLIHPGSLNGHLKKHIGKVFQSVLDRILPYAESCGVQLVVEPVLDQPYSKFTFHQTIGDTIELLDANPNLGVALDLYHVGMDAAAFERLPEYVDRVKLVQLADRTRGSWAMQRFAGNERKSFRLPLGEGHVRIEYWLSRLNALGYRGPFELELYGPGVGNCPFDLLTQSCAFMSMPTLQQSLSKPKST